MSGFRLMRVKETKPPREIYRVSGFEGLEVRSLHAFYDVSRITGYALMKTDTLAYIHIEYKLEDLRTWMKKQDLSFRPKRKTRKPARRAARPVRSASTTAPKLLVTKPQASTGSARTNGTNGKLNGRTVKKLRKVKRRTR